MNASAPVLAAPASENGDAGRFPRAPAEGWAAVGLVFLLCLTLAWSIADAGWVLGRHGLTDFLPLAMAMGVGWGIASAKAGWPRWLAHLLGALFASLVLPIVVGGVIAPDGGGSSADFQATAAAVAGAYLDLAVRGLAYTTQIGHFLLVLGIVCWATGQFAAYAVFHHRRPLSAVIVVGIGLVADMALTPRDQLAYLVLYSLAALFLLISFHAYDERVTWARRRIGDAVGLGGLYLRGGTVFVAVAVVAALALTAQASSAPLASVWQGREQVLVDLGREFKRFFPAGGSTRLVAVDFGSSAPITGAWTTDATPVLDIAVPDRGTYYWRAVAYDRFDGRSWSWSNAQQTTIPAGSPILDGTADDPASLSSRRAVTFAVRELGFVDPRSAFSPDAIASVDVGSTLTTAGADPSTMFAAVTAPVTSYHVTALVPIDGTADPLKGLTANKLRVAGSAYPAAIRSLYLPLDPATHGPATQQLLDEILARHPEAANSPYDLARSITTYLRGEGGFRYDTNVTNVDCGVDGVVECFARTRVGYCEYYASAMTVLLRMKGVPARFVEGFLPGPRDATGHELIRKSNSHAWVEAWFPGYGWVTFDPTGGGIGQDRPLPAGPVVTAAPSPLSSATSGDVREPPPVVRPGGLDANLPGGSASGRGSSQGPLIVLGLLLAIAMGALAFVAWQRGPRTPAEPDAVYRGLVRLARRLGFAPRPSQTIFEYTGALGEILPGARPDLQNVADAKVEVAYGRRELGAERLRSLRDAQRRLRVAMLGLLFRRRQRRDRRR
jgi:transglutaminase-like putative cysteine protease